MKAGIALVTVTFLAFTHNALADAGDRIEARLDSRGDRVENRLDIRGDRINHQLDRASNRAAATGHQ